jgi:hypothetical protein
MSQTARKFTHLSAAEYLATVLAPSTERSDRIEKFEACKRIPPLLEYGLLAQDAMEPELFRRRTHWQREFYQRDDTVTFESVGLTIKRIAALSRHRIRGPDAVLGRCTGELGWAADGLGAGRPGDSR